MYFYGVSVLIFVINTNASPTHAKNHNVSHDDEFQPVAVEYLQLKNQTDFEILKYTNYDELKGVSIENTNLTHIPLELFRKFHVLKEIKLKNNSMRNLVRANSNPDDIALMKNITVLRIENQSIRTLKNNTFQHFKKLKTLNLVCSEIENIEEDAFKGLGILENLDLSGNNITKFSSKVLAPLVRLKTLNLNNNRFQTAFSIFGSTRLKEFTTFYLTDNPMKGLNQEKLKSLFPKLIHIEYCSSLNQLCPKFEDLCLPHEEKFQNQTSE